MRHATTLVVLLAFVSAFGQDPGARRSGMYDVHKNGIIVTTDYIWSITAGYLRIMPIGQRAAAVGRIGLGPTWESGLDPTCNGDLGILLGGVNHFMEVGVGFYAPMTHKAGFAMFPNVCYRYIGNRGFLLKVGGRLSIYTKKEDIENAWEGQYGPWPLLQFGYNFSF